MHWNRAIQAEENSGKFLVFSVWTVKLVDTKWVIPN